MRPLSWAAVAAVVVIAIVVGPVSVHRSHVAHRQAAFNALSAMQSKIQVLEPRLADLELQFDDAMQAGTKISSRRHDRAMAGAGDPELMPLAKREAADVAKAQTLTDEIVDASTPIAQDYADLYDGSVESLADRNCGPARLVRDDSE